MGSKFKGIGLKNRTYYFFDDIINIKNFDTNKIKINEKPQKNILIYFIESVAIKNSKYVEIDSINPLYLIIGKMNGYFEDINGNIYLTVIFY